jgi:hypothetical protein
MNMRGAAMMHRASSGLSDTCGLWGFISLDSRKEEAIEVASISRMSLREEITNA